MNEANQELVLPAAIQTKQRILDAAERLFSQHGFAATSLRRITAEAQVNLAAVNYHFHSKEELIQAVVLRKLDPINRRRLEILDQLEAGGGEPTVEELLYAFFGPIFEARQAGVQLCEFPKLLARAHTEPGDLMTRLLPAAFAEILSRFGPAFRRALKVDQLELMWGMHLAIGSMAHLLSGGAILAFLSGGQADANDYDGAMRRLIRYTASGLRALAEKEDVAR